MTTAKPQQMVGQSDSADDLIAELAKLMAQDTHGGPVRQAAPQPQIQPQAAPATIRIPGMAAPADAGRAPLAVAPAPSAAPQPAEPRAEAPKPDPFSFDFGLSSPKREPQLPTPPAAPIVPPAAPVQVAAAPQPVASQPVTPVPVAATEADVHDTIADLIAAELNAAPEPVSPSVAPQPKAPEPSRQQAAGPMPAPTVSLRPAASVNRPQPEATRPALRPVNLTPVARPEGDKFRIAPVFGLGTTPPAAANSTAPAAEPARVEPQMAAPKPSTPVMAPEPAVAPAAAGSNPMEEIENLIGRAVRVDLDRAPERPAPSPALRSLATPIVAEPAAPRIETERMVASADEAILAAAAATGAEVGWVNPGDAARPQMAKAPVKRRRAKFPLLRSFMGPVVAVGLLLVAGFGLYWVLGLGRSDGPAPVLVADTSPIKQAVAAQPDSTAAQQSVVFNEIEGVVPGAEEQLVSRDQADVNEVTRIVTPDVNEEGIANRKVRTVTVRPDGSIVSGDDAMAGAAMLPVDRPSVPEVPGAGTASPELLASASALQAPAAAAAAPVTPLAPNAIPVVPGSNVPAVDMAGNPLAGRIAPVPYQRPASVGDAPPSGGAAAPVNAVVDPIGAILQPTNAAVQSTIQAATGQSPQMALAPSPAPAAPAAAAPATSAAAYAQLASQRSEADARATLDLLNRRYGLLFNGAQLQIQRADLGARGVYYRVILPTNSRSAAADLCTSVKSNGDQCIVM